MPFRQDILDLYPRAIRELNRRGVTIGYIPDFDEYELINKQGLKKTIKDSDFEKLERDLTPVGDLEIVEIELIKSLL